MNYNNLYYIQYSKAIEYLEKAIEFCDTDQRKILSAIIKVHQDAINNIKLQSLVVINPTKTEVGAVGSTLKKIVKAFYLNPIEKTLKTKLTAQAPDEFEGELSDEEYEKMLEIWRDEREKLLHSPYNVLRHEINIRCNETKLPDFIISSKILIYRKTNSNYFNRTDLDEQANEHLNLLMLQEFNNQNEQFIKTIKTNHYETSK